MHFNLQSLTICEANERWMVRVLLFDSCMAHSRQAAVLAPPTDSDCRESASQVFVQEASVIQNSGYYVIEYQLFDLYCCCTPAVIRGNYGSFDTLQCLTQQMVNTKE